MELIPADFAPESRVWVYQSNRPFSEEEVAEIDEQLYLFLPRTGKAMATRVKGWAKVRYNQFIVVMADEAATGVSGCSTDGMVRIVKSIERQYSVQLFDRMTLTFLVDGKAQMLPVGQVQYALDKGYITPDTVLFDNTILTKAQLEERWQVPLKNSWLANRLQLPA